MICSNKPRIKEIMDIKSIFFFTYIFFNMDISLTIYIIKLKFSMNILNVSVFLSFFLNLGPSFYFIIKNG